MVLTRTSASVECAVARFGVDKDGQYFLQKGKGDIDRVGSFGSFLDIASRSLSVSPSSFDLILSGHRRKKQEKNSSCKLFVSTHS